MTEHVFVDCFSAGLDELSRKEQRDISSVLRVLQKTKGYSTFESTDNQVIAKTMDKIFDDGYVRDVGGEYPWTDVELTEKGIAMIGESK